MPRASRVASIVEPFMGPPLFEGITDGPVELLGLVAGTQEFTHNARRVRPHRIPVSA